jgi:hypothetical protein
MKRLQENAVEVFFSLAERGLAAVGNEAEAADGKRQIGNYEAAHASIRSLLQRPEGHLPHAYFWSLGRSLEIAINLGRGSPDYWWLFQCLRDALNQVAFVADFEEEDAWVNAMSVAERLRHVGPTGLFAQNIYSRAAIVAQAFSRLAARGFEYEIKAQGVSLTATSFTGACKDVESLIIRLGV